MNYKYPLNTVSARKGLRWEFQKQTDYAYNILMSLKTEILLPRLV